MIEITKEILKKYNILRKEEMSIEIHEASGAYVIKAINDFCDKYEISTDNCEVWSDYDDGVIITATITKTDKMLREEIEQKVKAQEEKERKALARAQKRLEAAQKKVEELTNGNH